MSPVVEAERCASIHCSTGWSSRANPLCVSTLIRRKVKPTAPIVIIADAPT